MHTTNYSSGRYGMHRSTTTTVRGPLPNRQSTRRKVCSNSRKQIYYTIYRKGTLRIPAPSGDMLVSGYVFPDTVLSHNLARLSNLYDMGCTVTLTSTYVDICKDGTSVWRGTKEPHEKLWHLTLDTISGPTISTGIEATALPTACPGA